MLIPFKKSYLYGTYVSLHSPSTIFISWWSCSQTAVLIAVSELPRAVLTVIIHSFLPTLSSTLNISAVLKYRTTRGKFSQGGKREEDRREDPSTDEEEGR